MDPDSRDQIKERTPKAKDGDAERQTVVHPATEQRWGLTAWLISVPMLCVGTRFYTPRIHPAGITYFSFNLQAQKILAGNSNKICRCPKALANLGESRSTSEIL